MLSEVLIKALLRKAKEKGLSPDDYLLNLSRKDFGLDERAELYLKLNEKYLVEAKEYRENGDLAQAGEKYWGSLSSLLSAIAERRGWRHYHHRDYSDIIERLAEELKEPRLSMLFASAERLHANYYHSFLKPKTFEVHKTNVEDLIGRIKKVLEER